MMAMEQQMRVEKACNTSVISSKEFDLLNLQASQTTAEHTVRRKKFEQRKTDSNAFNNVICYFHWETTVIYLWKNITFTV